MKHIVITGSTRGIGFGLSDSFLGLGCSVTVSGRTQTSVDEAVQNLASKYDRDRILGLACDVRSPDALQALWDESKVRFERVDVWVNNAGFSGQLMTFWKMSPAEMKAVVETNVLGTLYGSQVAVRGMLEQGHGSLYNMEGMGSDGRKHDGLTLYGMTKYGLHYFTDCLVRETQGTSLIVGALQPGMVITDMIVKQYEGRPGNWARAKRAFNLLADRIETVTPWLAQQMLAQQRSGVRISWLSRRKLLSRMLLGPFRRRNLFDQEAPENPQLAPPRR